MTNGRWGILAPLFVQGFEARQYNGNSLYVQVWIGPVDVNNPVTVPELVQQGRPPTYTIKKYILDSIQMTIVAYSTPRHYDVGLTNLYRYSRSVYHTMATSFGANDGGSNTAAILPPPSTPSPTYTNAATNATSSNQSFMNFIRSFAQIPPTTLMAQQCYNSIVPASMQTKSNAYVPETLQQVTFWSQRNSAPFVNTWNTLYPYLRITDWLPYSSPLHPY